MMIQVSSAKKEKLADCAEKVLRYAGKLMQCVESLEEGDDEMGERSSYRMGMRGSYRGAGQKASYRGDYDPMDDDQDSDMYGERRGRYYR